MFGMREGLKYIKVSGKMISRGEYDTRFIDIRPYTAVTIIDEQGETLYFLSLSIPKRLDDHIRLDQPMSFIVLRYQSKEGTVGALIALDKEGKKLFFVDEVMPQIKLFVKGITQRMIFIYALPFTVPVGAVWSALLGDMIAGFLGPFMGVLAGVAAMIHWIYFLIFPNIQWKKYAGIASLEALLKREGFESTTKHSGKY